MKRVQRILKYLEEAMLRVEERRAETLGYGRKTASRVRLQAKNKASLQHK